MSDTISRQAAIDAIMGEPTDAHYPSWYAERLEQLPSAQPDVSDTDGDMISRKLMYDLGATCIARRDDDGKLIALGRIDMLPPVKHGKWIRVSSAKIYECSECGQNVCTGDIECYRFCHQCGARMDEDDR